MKYSEHCVTYFIKNEINTNENEDFYNMNDFNTNNRFR